MPKKNERIIVQILLPGTKISTKNRIASAMYKIDFILGLSPRRCFWAGAFALEAERFCAVFFLVFVCFFADNKITS